MAHARRVGLSFFLDLAAAFPNASWDAPRHILTRLGFPPGVVRAISRLGQGLRHTAVWARRERVGPDAVDGLGQGAGDSPGLLLLLIWVVWSYLGEGQEHDRMLYPDECYTELEQSWFVDDGLGMADIETIDEEGLQKAQGLLTRYNRAF